MSTNTNPKATINYKRLNMYKHQGSYKNYMQNICFLSLLHYRCDMASNRWQEELHVPKKTPHNSAVGFVVLDGELHVLTLSNAFDPQETRRKQHHKTPFPHPFRF